LFSPNPFSELVDAVDIHCDHININSNDCPNTIIMLAKQHCSILFIKTIVQCIVYFEYMLNYSWDVKKLSPYYFAHFGVYAKICLYYCSDYIDDIFI